MKHSEINWAKLIDIGKQLVGKEYNFGVEVDLDSKPEDIKALDCSELVEFLFHQIGIVVPDGSYNQAKICNKVDGANLLIGDLGFKWFPDTHVIHHVGVFLGNNEVLEAKGQQWGVVITPVNTFMASSHFAFWGRIKSIEDA